MSSASCVAGSAGMLTIKATETQMLCQVSQLEQYDSLKTI